MQRHKGSRPPVLHLSSLYDLFLYHCTSLFKDFTLLFLNYPFFFYYHLYPSSFFLKITHIFKYTVMCLEFFFPCLNVLCYIPVVFSVCMSRQKPMYSSARVVLTGLMLAAQARRERPANVSLYHDHAWLHFLCV